MKKIYRMENVDCANCAAKMEAAIAKLAGVHQASISFLTQRLSIELADTAQLESVMKEANDLCRKIEPDCRILF